MTLRSGDTPPPRGGVPVKLSKDLDGTSASQNLSVITPMLQGSVPGGGGGVGGMNSAAASQRT